ncbi:diguanylate cyclase [Vibrio sp. ED004]|uniref:diguanylate cyclase domain-containing protein n=1 Tax=Vibrio sp. ED004 TaxID=2785124 RepID=UPI0020BE2B5D|nr:diguanylate cyclase [Vibrio sp. ED004]
MHRALHDDLTQVFNRSAIYDWLKKPLKEQTEMSCLLLDIDDFKRLTTNLGTVLATM